jgi:hypothetical protein
MMRAHWVAWVVLGVLLGVPSAAAAQSAASGAIGGSVKDTTGAVLPGVTVEVASPALIEKVRTAVTDSQGNYRITDLRPGTYSVTFRLSGFTTVRREGIELTTGFTAPANAELSVGSLDETVTVTGASPVVDVQNTRSQNVLSSTVLDALPTNKNIQGFAAATVGVTFDLLDLDVGGNRHERGQMRINGGPTMKTKQDGMVFNSIQSTADGQFGAYAVNLAAMQEVALELSGISAESETGGVQLNYVPKDGGNIFSGTFDVEYGSGALQSSNLNDTLRARGLTTTTEAKVLYDVAEAFGGPIMRDRLWFFHSARWWGGDEYQPGAYFNSAHGNYIGTPDSGVAAYIPDLNRRAYTDSSFSDYSLRLTWQAAPKHKITGSGSWQKSCICYFDVGANVAPEASNNPHFGPVYVIQSTWNSPATNRLLLEAGITRAHHEQDNLLSPMTSQSDIVLIEALGTALVPGGFRYNSSFTAIPNPIQLAIGQNNSQTNYRASASYITGSHGVKVGIQGLWGAAIQPNDYGPRPLNYTLRGGVPVQVTQFASPHYARSDVRVFNAYAQDQWTIDRVTLNAGVRFDHFGGFIPEQVRPAGPYVAEFRIARIDGDMLPDWSSFVPRLGAAYDLFGNGRTAIKASIGKYMASAGGGQIDAYHPAATISTSTTRTWADANGNFVPDCDLTSAAANGECGARSNLNFGRSVVNDRRDPVLLEDGRAFNWQGQLSVSHELRDGWGVEVAYNRTWYGNFLATDNTLVTEANFDQYCVAAPVDPRLPQGGGYQICGLYDVRPANFGQVSNLVTVAENYGNPSQVYNGVRVTSNARFTNGALLTAGVSVGRTVTDNCFQNGLPDVTSQTFVAGVPPAGTLVPRTDAFCHVTPPWARSWQFKLNGVYPLPWWGIQTSGVFQVISGAPINAIRSYTNAEIAPVLGRNLAACPATGACLATVNVNLYPWDVTAFEPRLMQLDWRFGKIFRFGGKRLEGTLDIYNLLNENTVITQVATFGPTWQRPTRILAGRTLRLGAQFNF